MESQARRMSCIISREDNAEIEYPNEELVGAVVLVAATGWFQLTGECIKFWLLPTFVGSDPDTTIPTVCNYHCDSFHWLYIQELEILAAVSTKKSLSEELSSIAGIGREVR